MKNRRIQKGISRGKFFEIEVDGEKILAYEGETIAASLLAAGKRICRRTKLTKESRGIYCGMGICMGCAMIVNGRPNTLVCQTMATQDCKIQTQIGVGN
jgi:sarcosine oxidase subunit alpha